VATLDDLTGAGEERSGHIIEVLLDAFEDLIEADPPAFRRKFRKMAADPFAFYRGSACLFYADVVELDDPWADERTSRVWIQGDLHAENFGTYMDSSGFLVFDVNDFDEAYLGHFIWDLGRMSASVALLGVSKALSDGTIRELIENYARAYVEQVEAFASGDRDDEFRLTLENTEGTVRDVLLDGRLKTRVSLLDTLSRIEDHERRFREGPGVRRLDEEEKRQVLEAYDAYLDTIPEQKRLHSVSYRVKDVVGRTGFGIGSAGLPAYNLLIEGRSEALENDVVLSMKQGNVAAPSRVIEDERITGSFEHPGHRTAVSQHALQARADPWLGWCELNGKGQVVQELSPYESDLAWDSVTEPDEMIPLVRHLGQATAKIHCVSDAGSEQALVDFQTEDAITEIVGDDIESFAGYLADFGASYGEQAREDHRLFVDAFRNGAIPGLPGS
jgi:uncharacterized protein (DUF2252 family)